MNRAKVIGPPARDRGPRWRATSSGSPGGASVEPRPVARVVSGSRSAGGPGRGAPGPLGRDPPEREPEPGPDEAVGPPSSTGIGASTAAAVSAASHGSATRSGRRRSLANRSSAGGQPRSSGPSRWASRTRRVDEGAVRQGGQQRAERARAVALEQQPEDAPGRPPVGPPEQRRRGRGPQAALLDQRAGPAARAGARASGGRRRRSGPRRAARPPDRRRAGAAPRGGRAPAPRSRRGQRQARRAPGTLEQDEVERRVDIHRQAPPAREVRDRDACLLREPAGQRVVGREVIRQGAQGPRRRTRSPRRRRE